jgi:hypothetical protein
MNETIRRIILILLVTLALSGCASIPILKPLDPVLKIAVEEGCRRPFLSSKYRLVHALEMVMPDGKKGTAIGIVVADPFTQRLQMALMTLEGFVLFTAESGETLTVHRAIPPFDSPGFSKRMEEDIRLAFFLPAKEPQDWGRGEEDEAVCRFGRADGGFVDVSMAGSGIVEIRLYKKGGDLRKRVAIPSFNRDGLAESIEIRSDTWPSYTLHLRLIEGEAIGPEEDPSSGVQQ